MKLFIEKDLIISYVSHINSYDDLEIMKHTLLIIAKKCKMISITYSIDNDTVDENRIKDIFLILQKDITNLISCYKIKNEGYDFKKHLYNIKKIKEEKLHNDEHILMMNDSVIAINSIILDNTMLNMESLMNDGYEFIGLLESNEIMKHYQSWFWCCNKNIINLLLSII